VPSVKPEQFESAVHAGRLQPAYLFDGPDLWLKQRAVAALLDRAIKPEERDLNLDRFNGDDANGGDIANSLQTVPFLSERRVVVVQSADSLSAAESRAVAAALENLPPSTLAIFLYDEKASLRDPIPAQVMSMGVQCTFWTPFENQLPAWVIKETRLRGKGVAPEAARMIAEACKDLQEMSNEIDKLILFVGKKPTITEDDVEAYGLPGEEGDFKELERFLWQRDLKNALWQGRLLSDAGIRAEALFPIFERVLRSLLLGHHLRDEKRWGLEEVWTQLGIRGKTQQGNFSTGLSRYNAVDIASALSRLAQAEYDLKTGALPSPVVVSLLIMGAMGRPRTGN
jgi:DNA polymerase-3 subunit delta